MTRSPSKRSPKKSNKRSSSKKVATIPVAYKNIGAMIKKLSRKGGMKNKELKRSLGKALNNICTYLPGAVDKERQLLKRK